MLARWFLILIFAWTAGAKVAWPSYFRQVIGSLAMVPESALNPLANALTAVELALALFLSLRICVRVAAVVSLWLGLIFVGVHSYAIVSGTGRDCGCAGIVRTTSTRTSHVAMLSASVFIVFAGLLLAHVRPARGVQLDTR